MKRTRILFRSIKILLLVSISTPAKSITIDLFEDVEDQTNLDQYVGVTKTITTDSDRDTGLPGVIGGSRYLQIDRLASGSGRNTDAYLSVDGNSSSSGYGTISASADPGYNSKLTILWNGSESGTNPGEYSLGGFDGNGDPIGVNLLADGDNSFTFEALLVDHPITLRFTVTDTFGSSDIIDWNINQPVTNTINNFLFNTTNADYTSVQSISLTSLNEQPNTQIILDELQTALVPFEFTPSLGIILFGSFFGINKLRKNLCIL
jgi:hypothetical protein